MSEPSIGDQSTPPPRDGESRERDSPENPHPRKRQRVRLSCLECRRRKLSCDRELPCSRCIQSGTPEKCEYEARPGFAPSRPGFSQSVLASIDGRLSLPSGTGDSLLYPRKDALREHDRIRKLELEVAQLKNLLTKQASLDSSSTVVGHSPPSPAAQDVPPGAEGEASVPSSMQMQDICADKEELRFYRGREFKTRFYGPASAYIALKELAGLSPVIKFMRETGDEWLRPLLSASGTERKDRSQDKQEREKRFLMPDPDLEALLPSKEETDAGVSLYLEQFEQLHRIVHIPSFRREYAKFWDPKETRYAAFTVLVLAILSVTSCISTHSPPKFEKLVSNAHTRALRWIQACEEWEAKQSQKHRRLINYQISCLIYLSKRTNTVKKKRFWKGAGALILDAVSVGLHREPNPTVSPFNQEMRRRIWATLQNFDMQASFDHGLPSLIALLPLEVKAPRNIDDEDFDEESEELPQSKPATEYTYASYQHISRQSLPLRLELCRVLTGPGNDLDYDDVIRYTSEISREIDSLPSWDAGTGTGKTGEGVKTPLLAYTLLHIQLRAYIIPLHQSYLRLRKTNPKYQYSEMIYYSSVRDMILLNDALMKQGLRTLNFLREDNLTLAINLCSVTMLQPRGSTNMIMISSQDTMSLIEKCLQMKEDRVMRCGNNEPWGFSILCAARELLAVHLGEKSPEAAKAAAAERFVNLHLKLLAFQDPPTSTQQSDKQPTLSQQQQQPPPSSQPPHSSAANPFTALSAHQEISGFRSKSATPFPASQGSATQVASGLIEVPGTPWWVPNPSDPTAVTPQIQPVNTDFNFDHFGLDLNSLWVGDLGDWDGSL